MDGRAAGSHPPSSAVPRALPACPAPPAAMPARQQLRRSRETGSARSAPHALQRAECAARPSSGGSWTGLCGTLAPDAAAGCSTWADTAPLRQLKFFILHAATWLHAKGCSVFMGGEEALQRHRHKGARQQLRCKGQTLCLSDKVSRKAIGEGFQNCPAAQCALRMTYSGRPTSQQFNPDICRWQMAAELQCDAPLVAHDDQRAEGLQHHAAPRAAPDVLHRLAHQPQRLVDQQRLLRRQPLFSSDRGQRLEPGEPASQHAEVLRVGQRMCSQGLGQP